MCMYKLELFWGFYRLEEKLKILSKIAVKRCRVVQSLTLNYQDLAHNCWGADGSTRFLGNSYPIDFGKFPRKDH